MTPEKHRLSPPTVLIVDDEHVLRQLMKRALEERGYRVIAAEDGATAWELLQAGATVDAVVTDVSMTRMTGLELAALVATLPNAPPVVLVSGYRQDTSALGSVFLPKPFLPDQLANTVGQLLSDLSYGGQMH
jgi:two-component system, cell cycle sensor histidine kinase and response regulator CckA